MAGRSVIRGWGKLGRPEKRRLQFHNASGGVAEFAAMPYSELTEYCSAVLEQEFCLDNCDPAFVRHLHDKVMAP